MRPRYPKTQKLGGEAERTKLKSNKTLLQKLKFDQSIASKTNPLIKIYVSLLKFAKRETILL
jgi:hypothetical protein